MPRLKRPARPVPLLSALSALSLLVLGTVPAWATITSSATPRFITIDPGTLDPGAPPVA